MELRRRTGPPRTGKRALTPEAEARFVREYLAGRTQTELMVEFAISKNTANRIVARHGITEAMRVPAGHDGQNGESKQEDLDAYASLGAPPADDPLAGQEWLHRTLLVAVQRALMDQTLSPRARRRELHQLIRTATQATPTATIQQALRLIAKDQEHLEDGVGPELEDAPDKRRRARIAKAP